MPNKFDRIIKENFQGLMMSLVRKVLNIEAVEVVTLPRKIQRTLERELDALIKVVSPRGEQYLLNIEWQTSNDPNMHYRMLLYHAMVSIIYKLPVKGVMVYIGQEPMNMPAAIDIDHLSYRYEQIDVREINPIVFLNSKVPEEILLALLAGKMKEEERRWIIREILYKLRRLLKGNEPELNRKIAQLEVFGELRGVQKIILEEEQLMPFIYNLKNDIRYNQGLEKGREEGANAAITQRNTVFVLNLLRDTDYSVEKIAELADVSFGFVEELKNS